MRKTTLVILVGALLSVPVAAGNQARKSFVDSWQGRRVAIRRTLFTLVYDEHGRIGKTYRAKREGLTVVTPSAGVYFRFDGRDSEEDIVSRDPQQLMEMISDTYMRTRSLEIGFFQRIEPTLVARYEPGGVLVVKDVRIDHDRVRLLFVKSGDEAPADEIATALTIQWPMDLSASLTERPQIEALIRQFVDTVTDSR